MTAAERIIANLNSSRRALAAAQRVLDKEEFSFHVRGLPVTQGSMVASRWGPVHHSNQQKLDDWRELVRDAFLYASAGNERWPMFEGPVVLIVTVHLPRPKSRPKAEQWPMSARSGDVDKYARAIGDALGPHKSRGSDRPGIAYADDAQIQSLTIEKVYAHEKADVGVDVRLSVKTSNGLLL